jgi:SAM-dependent methyltransferase
MIKSLKASVPWWGKIGAKLVLSRLPLRYGFWQDVGLFRHGRMDSGQYAIQVFDKHAANSGFAGCLAGLTVLELGPGDGVATAAIAKAHGARAILVDAGSFAATAVHPYRALCAELSRRGLAPPELSGATTLDDVLAACEATYLTAGLESLRQIESGSVDLMFSQAVLEHIRRHEFLDSMRECRRILKPGGICSHRVDLKDHLGGGLNNLRFSERVWESQFFSRSGFYTNRLRFSEMLAMFRSAGFVPEVTEVNRWTQLPIERRRLSPPFRVLGEDELNVSGFSVLLRPEAAGSVTEHG